MTGTIHPLETPARPAADIRTLQAQVVAVQGKLVWARHANGCAGARRALSCLVEPVAGDLVLLALDPAGDNHHVLAVLERPEGGDAELTLPGGATLRTRGGAVQLQARAVRIDAEQRLSLRGKALHMVSARAETRFGDWIAKADTLHAQAGVIEGLARNVSLKLGRLVSRALESFRSVEGLDETRAGRSRTTVREHHRLQAGHITAQAEGFVKIDGHKIDLG